MLINTISKKYYSSINELLEKQVKIQLNNYEQREKFNTELRAFRHDYNNHISCLKAMLGDNRNEDASQYLGQLTASFPSNGYIYNTGNYIADAILTDKQEAAAGDGITISFDGVISDNISHTDLCIIISNSVDNAIEATRRCNGDKRITIFGGYQQGYFILIIKNPAVHTSSDSFGFLKTTKDDNINHGFGLANIKYAIKKYDGNLKTSFDGGTFTLSIVFNNV